MKLLCSTQELNNIPYKSGLVVWFLAHIPQIRSAKGIHHPYHFLASLYLESYAALGGEGGGREGKIYGL